MASETAKRAAGTFIADSSGKQPTVLAWATQQCRKGVFAESVKKFCAAQAETVDQSLVIVESITNDCMQCRIPCRCYDHEAGSTFGTDVRFNFNPQNGECCRVSSSDGV